MTRPATWSVSQEVFIRASPRKVFAAISDPRRLTGWLAYRATLDPRRGGDYSFTWRGGYHHEGKVLAFEPGRRIVLAWPYHAGSKVLGVTRFALSVRARAKGTLLLLEHSGFPRSPRWLEIYAGSGAGWSYYLMNLKSVLERGVDLRSPLDWMER